MEIDRSDEGIYRTYHDMEQPDLCVTISLALSEITTLDAEEVIPAFPDHVDPDALDQLFRMRPGGEQRHPAGRVRLTIKGYTVEIHSDGLIEISPVEDTH